MNFDQTSRNQIETGTHEVTENKQERIRFNLEESLSEYREFYKKNEIPLDSDFESKISEIWHKNINEMEIAAKDFNYNKIILIPNLSTTKELVKKLTGDIVMNDLMFQDNYSYSTIVDRYSNTARILLTHQFKSADEEKYLLATKGKLPQELSTATSKDEWEKAVLSGNPLTFTVKDQDNNKDSVVEGLTFVEGLLLSKSYYDKTGNLLEDNIWLPGSYAKPASFFASTKLLKNLYSNADYLSIGFNNEKKQINMQGGGGVQTPDTYLPFAHRYQ